MSTACLRLISALFEFTKMVLNETNMTSADFTGNSGGKQTSDVPINSHICFQR